MNLIKMLFLISIISHAYVTGAKKALIIGITGQDGSYLAELLLEKGYEVHGIIRRSSTPNTARIQHLYSSLTSNSQELTTYSDNNFYLHYGDITDSANIMELVKKIQPDEIYNLAAQSHVKVSFDLPVYTAQVDAIGVLNILEAVRLLGLLNTTKVYQASTSELFGLVQEIPQKETTPFHPRSPYGVAKLYGYWIIKNYRESYGIYACNGILFNHESPRRDSTFVTRKITKAVALIRDGREDCLYLGNLDAKRDWGHARDYVEAMWLILQQKEPDDYVIATGESHSVRDFVEQAFLCIGITLAWQGSGLDEVGYNTKNGSILVRIDPSLFRPSEVDYLIGDATKAHNRLKWKPRTTFKELVREMVSNESTTL